MKRVFIFGAGFSKPAGMPLATELLPLLDAHLELDELREWLGSLQGKLAWLSDHSSDAKSYSMNIEQVFHYAHFDRELSRLKQHLVPVGRRDGPGTPWNYSESIGAWLSYLEEALCDVIAEQQSRAVLASIERWANSTTDSDAVLTFNYDTLVERALHSTGSAYSHGFPKELPGISVFKLHGSIDWIVADRSESFRKLDLLFDKENSNRSRNNPRTGHLEDDCRLWRCRDDAQLSQWIDDRDLQIMQQDAGPSRVGIAGLGAYKQLHLIPGLGYTWAHGLRALYDADLAIVVGFSMSEFDAFAQMQFGAVARDRASENRALPVVVIDPYITELGRERFRRVFRTVEFVMERHESVNWTGPQFSQ